MPDLEFENYIEEADKTMGIQIQNPQLIKIRLHMKEHPLKMKPNQTLISQHTNTSRYFSTSLTWYAVRNI